MCSLYLAPAGSNSSPLFHGQVLHGVEQYAPQAEDIEVKCGLIFTFSILMIPYIIHNRIQGQCQSENDPPYQPYSLHV